MLESLVKTQERRYESNKSKQLNLEEGIHYMTHHVHNIKQKNGRINRFDPATGVYSANSVSPHADGFIDKNIEAGIKPVVEALNQAGYFTYSSCSGHCLSDRRFVGIAFPSRLLKIRFLAQMEHFKADMVIFRELESVINQQSSIEEAKITTIPYGEAGQRYVSVSEETAVFNIQFHCDSEQFYFVEMIILEGSDTCSWVFNPIKATKLFWKKLRHWDELTRKVAVSCKNLIL